MDAYIDSNVFIYATTSEEALGDECGKILDMIARGKIKALTSILSFDELCYKVEKLKGFQAAVSFAENFLAMPNMVFGDANISVIFKALEVIKQYRLAPRDAIHAATAQTHNVKLLVSDDKDFGKVKEIEWLGIKEFINRCEK